MNKYCILYPLILLVLLLAGYSPLRADTIVISPKQSLKLAENGNIEQLHDPKGTLTLEQVLKASFRPITGQIPNYGITADVIWLRFSVNNRTDENKLKINITYPILDEVDFFYWGKDGKYNVVQSGDLRPFKERPYNHQNFIFDLDIPSGATKTFLLRVRSKEAILVPVYVGTEREIYDKLDNDDLILAIYIGVIMVMILYNTFIFFTIKDWSYFYYIIYIISVGITQLSLQGFGYRYWWHNNLYITSHSVPWSGIASGIGVLLFAKNFLHVKERAPRMNKVFWFLISAYCAIFVVTLANALSLAYTAVDLVALTMSTFVLIYAFGQAVFRKYRLARFFVIAWFIFLLSVVTFVLKDVGIIPYNIFTSHILLIGSGVEVVMLSFVLADKINTYKKEKEESQALALKVSQENEQLVREQNVILETKVDERTKALQMANEELNIAMKSLKEAQTKLVEKEKMASLGQLTAGIAHEINNPINFVTSNIKPLKLDILDIKTLLEKYGQLDHRPDLQQGLQEIDIYKKEIDIDFIHEEISSLIKGIEDGAARTAEIVKGLRTFSRLDESEVKSIDIHEGLDSTLVLLHSSIPPNVRVVRNYAYLPKIECYAGKVNQVFMNILTNAFNAVKNKQSAEEERVVITTGMENEDEVRISIIDTGIGMNAAIREKIFDPFFTTKDVGEGTGLGLSIVFSIIEKHNGRIVVNSAPGKGAEFIIYLPLKITNLPT